jgi:hypothetical protein
MIRTMCSYEHGIRDDVRVIREDNVAYFNRELQAAMGSGWRLIQPIETHGMMPDSGSFAKVIHVAVLARCTDHYDQ